MGTLFNLNGYNEEFMTTLEIFKQASKKAENMLLECADTIEQQANTIKELEQRLKAGHVDTIVIGMNGEVIRMGEMYVDDEKLMGVFVLCDKEEFTKQTGNLLYMDVKITPKDQ